jgi:two-component system, sensor histidine kinase
MTETEPCMILNVDDDAANLYAKSRILKRAGYEIIEAGTGLDALRLVKETRPQLVLLDVKLPDITGLDVCRMIKQDPQSAHIMVLQISASHITTPDRVLGLACGADTYLTEPVESTELLATVQALLRLYKREEENRQLLAQLREADRQKDDFLATLAHELRNPLHPIRGAVELMRLNQQLDPETQWSRDVIDQQVNHLARLIDDLLDVARITRDKLELRKEKLCLAEVIKGAVESTRTFLESHGHQAIVALPPETVQLEGDSVRLTQILVNLLNNAAKYTPKGEKIWLSATVVGDRAIISVKDSGVGIASDKLPRVFEKFYQVDRSLERSESGLGLGLTLTRRLVELHGGTLEARSDGLGNGSEFLVSLPILPSGETAQSIEHSSREVRESEARWRVLIVDDGARTREMYSMLLRKRGHEVETAADGQTGIEIAGRFRPDVILLDVGMPRLNGFDTCRLIRELPFGKDIVMIAVTGWAQEEVQQRADESGFDGILVKPAGVQQIIQLASTLLESKRCADSIVLPLKNGGSGDLIGSKC